MFNRVSRRGFLGLMGGAASVAGLGLTACGNKNTGDAGSAAAPKVSPQEGVPATTPLDKLPLPEQGKTCDNPLERDQIKDGGTAIFPVAEITSNFNSRAMEGNSLYMQYFWSFYNPCGLVIFNCDETASTFEPNPDFVKSAKAEEVDGKQIVTIDFADKATFNDGTPIDWRALEAAWKTCSGADEAYIPAATDGFSSIESVVKGENDKQAVVTFKDPFYPWEAIMQVIHPDAADPETFNTGYSMEPHNEWAAGPFVVDSFDDTQITFKRNDKWWGEPAKLDTVTFKAMESQAMFNAFKNGEIDSTELGGGGTKEMLSNFTSMKDAYIRRADSLSIACIEVNTEHEAMKDEAIRKAFMQCINVDTMVKIAYEGVNWSEERIGSLMISPWMDGYENNLPKDVSANTTAEAQVEAARKTLEDAGFELDKDDFYAKDGKRAAFSFTAIGDSNVVKNRAAAIQQFAKNAGMEVTIENKPSSEFSNVLTGGEWDTILFGWTAGNMSYNNGGQIYGSESASNFTHAGSAELDAKFAKVTTISDHKEQMKAFNEAEKEALESYAFIPLYGGCECVVCKKGLANWGPSLLKTTSAENIGWEK